MNKEPLQLDTHTVHEQVSESPSKTQLVLVHGLGVSGDYYLPFAKEMEHLYDIHIIDLPGFGNTPKKKKAYKRLSSSVNRWVAKLSPMLSPLILHRFIK